MKNSAYTIQNLKCGGCATQIISKLSKLKGVSNVKVDELSSTVSIDHTEEALQEDIIETLHNMGYPLFDEDNSLGEKAKSYVSCVVGRVKKKASNSQ